MFGLLFAFLDNTPVMKNESSNHTKTNVSCKRITLPPYAPIYSNPYKENGIIHSVLLNTEIFRQQLSYNEAVPIKVKKQHCSTVDVKH